MKKEAITLKRLREAIKDVPDQKDGEDKFIYMVPIEDRNYPTQLRVMTASEWDKVKDKYNAIWRKWLLKENRAYLKRVVERVRTEPSTE